MQTIWKYEVPVIDRFEVPLPVGAVVLSVQCQRGTPCIWVQVNTNNPGMMRRFGVFGTGNPMPEVVGNYVGTFQLNNGTLVFHLYEMP